VRGSRAAVEQAGLAARNAPLQTLTMRRACGAAVRIQSMTAGSARASSTPMPPGSTMVSIGSFGSGGGLVTNSSPVKVVTGPPSAAARTGA
jgi:hypothetical protein